MKKFIPSQNSPNANKLVKESKGKVSQNRRNINFCYWIKLHIKSKHRFSNFHLSKWHRYNVYTYVWIYAPQMGGSVCEGNYQEKQKQSSKEVINL